jgi:hypothetical protein
MSNTSIKAVLTPEEIARVLTKAMPEYSTYRWPLKNAAVGFADALDLEGEDRRRFLEESGFVVGPRGGVR